MSIFIPVSEGVYSPLIVNQIDKNITVGFN